MYLEGGEVVITVDKETRERLLVKWKSLDCKSSDYLCSVRAVSVLLCHLVNREEVCGTKL